MGPQDGLARLGVAAPGAFVPLGEDGPEFLRRELRALGVASPR
ncbi:hypothetical protein OV203_01210 [Nannocystis sp. ILAH1]|nr:MULTISPECIES: hypothetical protein [unclassified Nannocystis]MCY0985728.1 hypothetical protein [Nannocystis sp. ILAH1]MCY1068411.1 hypothetical protein [Nannocystis sp. RBIL2]